MRLAHSVSADSVAQRTGCVILHLAQRGGITGVDVDLPTYLYTYTQSSLARACPRGEKRTPVLWRATTTPAPGTTLCSPPPSSQNGAIWPENRRQTLHAVSWQTNFPVFLFIFYL